MPPIPAGLEAQLKQLLPAEDATALLNALETPPTVSVRLNPAKHFTLPPELRGEPVEWHAQGLRLARRPNFTLMPQMHAGGFYVQDASSMAVAPAMKHVVTLLATDTPLRVLDACAAPGGKSTCIVDELPQGSLLVSNEYDHSRAQVLAENITKWGAPGCVVTRGDTSRLSRLHDAFDIILCDAPCSGEGMMRKEAVARSQWSTPLVEKCAALQDEILENLWEALRPGGFLIYSTCTFNRRENEERILALMERHDAESIGVPALSTLPGSPVQGLHAVRFMPHLTRGEGLFMSVLRKPGSPAASSPKKQKVRRTVPPPEIAAWVNRPDACDWVTDKAGAWHALPPGHAPFIALLQQHCDIIMPGTAIAEPKGRDLAPSHALALSRLLNTKAFPTADLTLEQALDFLRRLPPALPPATPKGFVLARYDGMPLGWLKNIGLRANNLYPAHWRIRNL